jgi:hypothetical protein
LAESGEPISHEQATAILGEVLDFMSGGLEAIRRREGTGDRDRERVASRPWN